MLEPHIYNQPRASQILTFHSRYRQQQNPSSVVVEYKLVAVVHNIPLSSQRIPQFVRRGPGAQGRTLRIALWRISLRRRIIASLRRITLWRSSPWIVAAVCLRRLLRGIIALLRWIVLFSHLRLNQPCENSEAILVIRNW